MQYELGWGSTFVCRQNSQSPGQWPGASFPGVVYQSLLPRQYFGGYRFLGTVKVFRAVVVAAAWQ